MSSSIVFFRSLLRLRSDTLGETLVRRSHRAQCYIILHKSYNKKDAGTPVRWAMQDGLRKFPVANDR